MEHLPNFFIVGSAKAGTTSMYEYLKQHHQIYLSPIKEPNHFSSDIDISSLSQNFKKNILLDVKGYVSGKMDLEIFNALVREWDDYIQLFKNVRDEKAIGEISNSYLYSSVAAKNIKERIPDAKIIVMLRNPIDRMFSHYMMDLRMGYTNKKFREAVLEDFSSLKKGWGVSKLYIELGLYSEQVKRYYDIFPENQIHIILYDDYKVNSKNTLNELLAFFDLEQCELNSDKYFNEASSPRFKSISSIINIFGLRVFANKYFTKDVRNALKNILYSSKNKEQLSKEDKFFFRDFFKDDINKLEKNINRDLSFWK